MCSDEVCATCHIASVGILATKNVAKSILGDGTALTAATNCSHIRSYIDDSIIILKDPVPAVGGEAMRTMLKSGMVKASLEGIIGYSISRGSW